jgi:hypothetical protein
VHRDVSPQNIFVTYEGIVKVLDFGVAKAANRASHTQGGQLKGKFGYMSPEQVRGVELDHRSDLFACGILLWELLVGDRLFLGESDFSTLEKVRNVEMVPPTHFNKNLSPQVERIVMKALAKNRDDRYRFASEMAEDLQRYLISSDQPFARTDLQRYMHQHFAEEIQAEQERLEKYRELRDDEIDGAAEPFGDPVPGIASMPTSQLPMPSAEPTGFPPPPARGPMPTALKARPLTFTGHLAGAEGGAPPDLGDPHGPLGGNGVAHGAVAEPSGIHRLGMPLWAKVAIGVIAVLSLAGIALLIAGDLIGPGTGSLSIQVTPNDADIYLNDTKLASTSPFNVDSIEPGNYVLMVKKAGFKDTVRPVRVQAGLASVETVTLEPEAGSASIFVRTTPSDLEILLDGAETQKRTPATLTQVKAGDHELALKHEGELVYRANLTLTQGGAEVVEVDISRLPPILEVDTDPADAEISVDGKKAGAGKVQLGSLKPGTVVISAKKKGCKPAQHTAQLKPGVTRKVSLKLECR